MHTIFIVRSNKRNALCETKTMRVDTSVDTTIQFKFEQYELLYYGIELNSIHNLSTLHNKTIYSTIVNVLCIHVTSVKT